MNVCFLLTSLFSLVLCQYEHYLDVVNGKYGHTIDFIHNYRFEDHYLQQTARLLVAISDIPSDKSCYFTEVSPDWEHLLQSRDNLEKITEDLYALIKSGSSQISSVTLQEVELAYGYHDAITDCLHHSIYQLKYSPNFTTVTPDTSTTQSA